MALGRFQRHAQVQRAVCHLRAVLLTSISGPRALNRAARAGRSGCAGVRRAVGCERLWRRWATVHGGADSLYTTASGRTYQVPLSNALRSNGGRFKMASPKTCPKSHLRNRVDYRLQRTA
jgi:hypothetical protein